MSVSAGSVTVTIVNNAQTGLPPSFSFSAAGTGLALDMANAMLAAAPAAASPAGTWLGTASAPGYTGGPVPLGPTNLQLYVAGLIQDLSNALATVLAPHLS